MSRLTSGWIGWVGLACVVVVSVRLMTGWALPLLPEVYAWSGSAVLGLAFMLLFKAPPNERRN
jgi:hypothetical protein